MTESGGPGTPMSERMQSLLSRAAEDQLSEQRQIAGVLTDLRAQVQRITADIAALREQAHTGGGSDAALSTVSADVREAVRLLGERIDGVARLVQQRGNDLAEIRGLVEQTQGAVRGQGEAVGGLSSGLTALPAFGERIGGLQDTLNALHERLAGLDALSGSLGALQQRVDGVDQGLRDLRSAFAAVGARMAELPGRPDLEAMAQRSTAPLAELHEQIAGVHQSVAAVAAQISAAADQADQGDQSDEADAAQRVDELRAELARFAAAARDETQELAQRLTALDRRLTEVLDAVTPEEVAEDEAETGEEEYVEDPVLTELADLREALLGDDGLAARVEAAGAEDLDTRVSAAVESAVAASEERLAAHIDEAVLALAEALLRRRSGSRMATSPISAMVGPPAPAPTASPEPTYEATEEPADGVGSEADGGADEEPDAPAESAQADEPSAENPASGPAWQTPRADPAGGQPWPPAEDNSRRRRPWWRPGD